MGVAQRGNQNPNWRGGKTIDKKGYKLIKAKEHPRNHNGYVFEHIMVMEGKIGRPLIAGENVHHVNGVRNDNRPENLELWTRPQPIGIRVVDAIIWAKDILATYGEDEKIYIASIAHSEEHSPLKGDVTGA